VSNFRQVAAGSLRATQKAQARERVAVLRGLAKTWRERAAANPDASAEAATAADALYEALAILNTFTGL
jgi:hypothetical protein